MKRLISIALSAAALVTVAAPVAVAQFQLDPNVLQPLPRFEGPLFIDPGILVPNCPDPAVVDFAVTNVTASPLAGGGAVYDFNLRATIRNVGGSDWMSGANQQSADIFRVPNANIGHGNFPNLAAGAEITVVSSRITGWSESSEFLPSFEARISLDPDIAIDNNPNNDECSSGNNSRTLTPDQISAMLP